MTAAEAVRTTPPAQQPPKAPKRNRIARAQAKETWLLLLPALIPVAVLSVYPLVQGILLGFTDAKAGLDQVVTFSGLQNYFDLLGDSLFWSSFRIGAIWAISVTLLQFLAALGLALLLNLNLRGRWLARTLALVPWAIPPVTIAIMWRLILNPDYGPVNQVLEFLGLPGDINWLGSFAIALPTVIVVGVWSGMPQTTITLLAGLQNISGDLHEAAAIDGAGALQRFWHVTLPGLQPVIIAITTLDLIWNFNSFALVYVLTAGGPGGQTMLPMLFAYNEAFRYGEFGSAAAMGNVMVVVISVFLVLYLRAQARAKRA